MELIQDIMREWYVLLSQVSVALSRSQCWLGTSLLLTEFRSSMSDTSHESSADIETYHKI